MKAGTYTVEILDTTLRDGEQTQGVSFSPAEKTNIAKALLQHLRVNRIEIASAGASEKDREAVHNITTWSREKGFIDKVEILGFIDHKKSVDWIVESGGTIINFLAKGSEKHCRLQLGKTIKQHLADIKKSVNYALKQKLGINIYLEAWSSGYSENSEFVFELMDSLKNLEIRRYMLGDTLGIMSPDEVYDSLSDMIKRYPAINFDFHPHNDYGLATANSLMAVRAGIRTLHCTINCLGERAGNASLAEVVVNLKDRMGADLTIDESHLMRLSNLVSSFSGKRVSENTPIVGEDVFTQTAGIHADGDKKGGLYRSMLKAERFKRKHSYALGKLSGKASLDKKLEELGLHLSEVNRDKVLRRVIDLGESKKSITTEDLPIIIADVLETEDYSYIQLHSCTVTSGLNLESTASIHIQIGDEKYTSSGGGNGGYHAFMVAVKKVLDKRKISFPKLIDYEIKIPRGGKTSALVDCIITWHDGAKSYKTRGVHSDQVVAAVEATIKMLNLHIHG